MKVYLVVENYIGEWNSEEKRIITGYTKQEDAEKFIEKYDLGGCPYDFSKEDYEDYYGDLSIIEIDVDNPEVYNTLPYSSGEIINSYDSYCKIKERSPFKQYDCYIDKLENLLHIIMEKNGFELKIYDTTEYIPESIILMNRKTADKYNLKCDVTKDNIIYDSVEIYSPDNERIMIDPEFKIQINSSVPDDTVVLNERMFDDLLNENGTYQYESIKIFKK